MGDTNLDLALPEEWSVREILSAGYGGCLYGLECDVRLTRLSLGGPRPGMEADLDFRDPKVTVEFIRRVAATGNGCSYLVKSGGVEASPHAFRPEDATRYLSIRDNGCDA